MSTTDAATPSETLAADQSSPKTRKRRSAPKTRKRRSTKTPEAPKTKQAQLVALMLRRQGAAIGEMASAIGWQPHSVRGAISGALKKKLGLTVITETVAGRGRIYRLQTGA